MPLWVDRMDRLACRNAPLKLRTGKLYSLMALGTTQPLPIILMLVKFPRGPLSGSKRSVYLNKLSRCATKSVMILHSSPSKVVRWTCILAFTGAYPLSLPVTLHSNGCITYRPSLKEARGSQRIFRTRTSLDGHGAAFV